MTIDVHTHIFPGAWPDFAARYGGDRWPRLEGDPATGCRLYLGTTLNRSLTPHAFDPARRLEDMDRTGVERQLLSAPGKVDSGGGKFGLCRERPARRR